MNHDDNYALLDFADHWRLDGDYLRCRKCKRPHIASKESEAFMHAPDCKLAGVASSFPWKLLREILNADETRAKAV